MRRGAAPLGEWATGPSEDSLVVWTPASSPELSLLALGEVPGAFARALGVAEGCRWAWRHYSFDVMPMDGNTAWFDGAAGQGRAGVCLLDGQLGRVPFDGEYAGGCVLPGAAATAFGGFDMLLALPPTSAAADAADAAAADAGAPTTFYYQCPPTLRLQPGPSERTVRAHTDEEYGHQPGELNCWMPLTAPALTRTTLWAESAAGRGDDHPLEVDVGQIALFHGTVCRHHVPANGSVWTRASLDFRVGVAGYFDPSWSMRGTKEDHTRRTVVL